MYNSYKNITSATTTTFAGETKRVILASININQTTTGTVTIKAGTTTIGIIAAGKTAGQLWHTTMGTEIEDLQIVNTQPEDITVMYRNI